MSLRKRGSTIVSRDFYPTGRHEMLNEINWDEVLANLLGWITALLERREDLAHGATHPSGVSVL